MSPSFDARSAPRSASSFDLFSVFAAWPPPAFCGVSLEDGGVLCVPRFFSAFSRSSNQFTLYLSFFCRNVYMGGTAKTEKSTFLQFLQCRIHRHLGFSLGLPECWVEQD